MNYRRFFFDTEFMEDGHTIELISIGCVPENEGRTYYACNVEADLSRANPWVQEHVLPKLPPVGDARWKTREQIAIDLMTFWFGSVVSARSKNTAKDLELWTYYGSYDWVVLCQLFGRMIDLPTAMPMLHMDIKMLARLLDDPELPEQDPASEHDALEDAKWNRTAYLFLRKAARTRLSSRP